MSRTPASVQTHYVALREVRDEVLCLAPASGHTARREYRAVLEVNGLLLHLRSEEEQAAILARFQRLLAGLTHPLQLLIRVLPVQLEPLLAPYVLPAQSGDSPLAPLASSMMQVLRGVALKRALLERKMYVIIPASTISAARTTPDEREDAFVLAAQQLALRCREMATAFAAMGLTTHRLDNAALVNLQYQCLRPQAQAHPLFHPQVLDQLDTSVTASVGGQPSKDTQQMHSQSALPLPDLLSPARIELQRACLLVDGQYASTLVVTQLPRVITAGWLRPLIELDQPIEISLHVQPRSSEETLRHLRRRQLEIESSFLLAHEQHRLLDPTMQVAQGDLQGLLAQLASGEERLLDWSMYVLVHGETQELLRAQTARVRSVLSTMLVNARPALFEQHRGYYSCQPQARNTLGASLLLPSAAVATSFPFLATTLRMEQGVLEGLTPAGEPVVLDWWAASQRNANRLLVAPSGSGKSFKAKLDLLRLHLWWSSARLRQQASHTSPATPALSHQQIVIDPEREYQRIAVALGGQWIRLAAGSQHHLNPFDLPRPRLQAGSLGSQESEGDVLADHVQHVLALLDIMLAERRTDASATLSSQEKGLLDLVVYETYRRAGISRDPATHGRAAPLLSDLARVLESGSCGPDASGLSARLQRFVSGSLAGLFAGATNVALDNPLIVFDVYDLSEDLRPLGFFLISSFVWTASFGSCIPRQLIVDELLSLYQYREGARFLETLFQRARKHYLGITGITQHPALLEHSTIPANCATQILLAQESASLDLLATIFHLSHPEQEALKHFGKGDGLLLSQEQHMVLHFVASAYEHQLATTDRQELRAWEEQATRAQDLSTQPTSPLQAMRLEQVVRRAGTVAGTVTRKGWWSFDAPR